MTNPPPPHRTQIPNIVDDLGLDPYERALYVHYKRVCGENQGAYCYEAVKTTAHKVKMSTGQVSVARRQLAKRGLILVQDGRPVIVTVLNIWELNTAFYKLEHRPDVDGWTVEQLKLWLADVHTVNVSSHNDSNIDTRSETNLTYNDKDVHTVNEHSPSEHSLTNEDNMSSNVHTVKQRIDSSLLESIKDNPITSPYGEGGPPPPIPESGPKLQQGKPKVKKPKEDTHPHHGKMFVTLTHLCRINLKSASGKQKGQLGTACEVLVKLVSDIDQFKEKFPKYWAQNWRGKDGTAPSPAQIQEVYGDYCFWLENGESYPKKNGAINYGTYQRNDKQLTGHDSKSKPTYDKHTDELVYPDGTRVPAGQLP